MNSVQKEVNKILQERSEAHKEQIREILHRELPTFHYWLFRNFPKFTAKFVIDANVEVQGSRYFFVYNGKRFELDV